MTAARFASLSRGLPPEIPAQVVARFTSNLGFRLVFPFLPTIARGLDTSLGSVGVALSGRELMGLGGPVLGAVTDRGWHRRTMLAGLLLFSAGCLLAGGAPGIGVFVVAMALTGAAKVAFDTAMGAWIGERVAFLDRGRVTGITELSWAAAFLVGIPVMAVVVELAGWRGPFLILAVANVLAALWVRSVLAPDEPRREAGRLRIARPSRDLWVLVLSVVAVVFGHQLVLVTFGAWFEDDFGLDAGGLGLLAVALGLAELVGTVMTVAVTDRIGKRVSVAGGALIMVLPMAAFGVADSTILAVLLVGLTLLGFEFSFISALPYATEVQPEARGATLGVLISALTVTRAVGSVAGTRLYDGSGIGTVGVVAAASVAVGAVLIGAFGREPG